jgi:hypothetical protein
MPPQLSLTRDCHQQTHGARTLLILTSCITASLPSHFPKFPILRLKVAIVHICTDFVNVGLGSNSLINSKIDEVLTVDLALGEMIASWPPATRVTLSLILTDPPPASLQAGGFPLVR